MGERGECDSRAAEKRHTVMERTIFLQHYRICLRSDGTPRELSRDGAAITYEAVDERSREPVDLKLIPLQNIDPAVPGQLETQARAAQNLRHVNIAKVFDFGREGGDLVCISEHLPGETLAAWVAAHGPMPADAALRVAEQIVSVLSSASFHKLTFPPIQPSDIIVVPGQTPEGTWPLVKLINFGLPALTSSPKAQAEDSQTRGEASSAEQFASSEQLPHGTTDVRSEIYSLGATLYFLLTGVALSADAFQRPPKFSGFPKALRTLFARMLHRNPDQRPKDLVVLAETIRECLLKIERRRALADKYGIPYRTTIPRRAEARPARLFANSIAGCRVVVSHSSHRSRPVLRADWQNRARDARDKKGRGPDRRARVFATASGPKCFDGRARDCGISRSKPGCAEREPEWEPTGGECGERFKLASGCNAGYSADSNTECSISSNCSERSGSNFAAGDRRKFCLFC